MRWSKSCENVHPPALTGTAPINHKQASLVLRLANLNFRMLRRRALPSCFQYRGDDLRLNLDGSDSRANRAVTTPTGSISQHPAAAEEAAGFAVASCGRAGPGTRCVSRRAPC